MELPATCSVPHCLVARNHLPRWRHAAVQLFKYPAGLPFTLHAPRNPEERLAWMAEMDLDPGSDAKGRNSIALLKSQQTFQQTFQQSF